MTPASWYALAAAPFVGSFLGLLVERLPAGRSWSTGRSACDSCQQSLGMADLVPVLSFALRRGRCRCGAILLPLWYPGIELVALAVAVMVVTVVDGWLVWPSLALGWTLLTLAVIDWRHYILPDILTLPLIPAGLAIAWAIDPTRLLDHGLGAIIGFAALFVIDWLYRFLRGRDGLGLGDAKLLAAAGAWLGVTALPSVILIAAFSCLLVVLVKARRGMILTATTKIAFGPYLALAIWVLWLGGPLYLG